MKSLVVFPVLLILCVNVGVVRTGEPDPSFTNTLASFLNSLFGADNTTSTTTSPGPNSSSTMMMPTTPPILETTLSGQATNGTTTQTNYVTVSNKTTTYVDQANLTSNHVANLTTTEYAANLTTSEQNVHSPETTVQNTDQTGMEKPVTESPTSTGTFPSTFSYPRTSSAYSSYVSESPPEFKSTECFEDTIVQNFCSAPSDLTDVSFWDLYSAIFSDSVLDGLMMACVRGTWCLKDKYDYWDAMIAERVEIVMNSEIVNSTCQPGVLPCLDNMADFFKNCSFYYQMVFASESIDLLCKMKSNYELTDGCYKHVIEALHVTLADLVRERSQSQDYVEQDSGDTCDTPEAYMTQGLICIANSCPGEADTFKSFKPWTWFTNIVDELISECRYNITECVALLQKPQGYVGSEDLQMMIMISTSTMVSAILMSLTVCVCYRRYRRNAVIKDGYQQLLNDGDES